MTILQRLVLPNLLVQGDEDMYLRHARGAWTALGEGKVHFEAGSVVSTDTFYNGLTVGAWKRHCEVADLRLRLVGAGEFVLTFGLHRHEQASIWLAEHRLSLTEANPACIALDTWADLADGLLFMRLRALGPATLTAAAYETEAAPRNEVRLGLVVTHFQREAQVASAVARIRRAVLDDPGVGERITLTVVDNSRSLELAPHPRITHIPNRNLGGTGGFVRGLLSLLDGGQHTHALFMDDDASCETESITRALALLQFAVDPKLAVAGALLREAAPWELIEKGACFGGTVAPLHPGLDMRSVGHLLESEREQVRPDYGAWWFFAFPVREARRLPFPFFVRGDDVFFGLRNDFRIMTLNGVACLGEDFGSKHGPMTAYLDARYHLVHALLDEGRSWRGVWWVGSRLFVKAITGYLYASAGAVTLAMQHVLEGPEFFHRHLDIRAVRAVVNAWTPTEKLGKIDRAALNLKAARDRRESPWRRWVRALTLQGFLLPGWLIRERTTVQPKSFHGRASGVFRYRHVLYEHEPSGTGFLAHFDRRRFFGELGSFVKVWVRLFAHIGPLRRAYAQGALEMSTLAFWRRVYQDEGCDAPPLRATVEAGAVPGLDHVRETTVH